MADFDVIKSGSTKDITVLFDALDVASASYSLFDISGSPVLVDQPLYINEGDLSTSFIISGEHNTLDDEKNKDMRRVLVKTVSTDGRVGEIEQFYAVVKTIELDVPSESFITLMEAKLAALDVYDADSFMLLSDHVQRQVLIEATNRIKTMRFSLKRIYKITDENGSRPQNVLTANTLPFYLTDQYSGEFVDFTELTTEQYLSLPAYFIKDVTQSCMNEAISIVTTNGAADAREEGLLSESIGETTNMYRSGRSAARTLSRKTWRLLSRYTDNVIRVGRG
uniref:Uncharacterized protein n=1 Tax=Pectobacterium carotovorum TaxID=554 RepID=A0A0K0MNR8_PECCA|nr:hypothetical protein [Pectobacterium carotovorum]AKG47470.1 hypothetical protein pA_00030 [Pectobacterium carotovorum]